MKGQYKGKEICQGCGLSGNDKPREDKNRLCRTCQDFLYKGKSIEFELKTEYIRVVDWHNGYADFNFDTDISLDKLANIILEALNNEKAKVVSEVAFPRRQHAGQTYYKIPLKIVEPLKDFFQFTNEYIKNLKKSYSELGKQAKEKVSEEKDRIYNEGIERGRQILVQLNDGAISMNDFNSKETYKN